MTWQSITLSEADLCRRVILWIKTVRAEGYPADWLPSEADMAKSALLERLRGGLDPLPRSPPCGMACPWYALVEDAGPHYAGSGSFGPHFWEKDDFILTENQVSIFQNVYDIISREDDGSFILADGHHFPQTPWRFRLFYDKEWSMPGRKDEKGGWFIRNMEFEIQLESTIEE